MKFTRVLLLLLIILIFPALAGADNFSVSVTRKGNNLYKIDGQKIYIHTRYCYEYAYSENAFLKMSGYFGILMFLDSRWECDVQDVYGYSEQKPGKYAVTLTMKDSDWYEIGGNGIYIKTIGCPSLALEQQAILSISSGGYGTLYVDNNQCMVEGLYSRMSL